MELKRIKLDTLKNTRDLGGIKTADGHSIRSHMLIRSGQLAGVTEKDFSILKNEYGLKTVIDLRTDAEMLESPDELPEGIGYISLPLLDNSFLGIARDEFSMKSWLNVFRDSDAEPEEIFSDMYQKLVFGERSEKFVRQFFDILLKSEGGSVLWHCSAGKDRVGIMTMLLLGALGADRETITKDYLATEKFLAADIIRGKILAPFVLHNRKLLKCFNVLLGVKREYPDRIFDRIEKEYGSMKKFLSEHFGITEEEIIILRKKYLI